MFVRGPKTTTTAAIATRLSETNALTNPILFSLLMMIPSRDACLLMLSYCNTDFRKKIIYACTDEFASQIQREDKFMEYVCSAEQDQKYEEYKAVTMLRECKELFSVKRPLLRHDGQTMMLNALQKTLYSLDGHLREKLMEHMPPDEISKQLCEYVSLCKTMDCDLFVRLTRTTQANDKVQAEIKRGHPDTTFCIEAYGAAQDELLALAPNFIHQICHPDENRTLTPCPDFANEVHLPRCLKAFDYTMSRMIELIPRSGLGTRFYLGRANEPGAFCWHTATDAAQLDSDKQALLAYEKDELRKAQSLLANHRIECAVSVTQRQSNSSLDAVQTRPRTPNFSNGT